MSANVEYNNAKRPTSTTTVIKYEKSSCYFCNEWFDSHSFTEHLIHCGQVLELCPNSCGSHVSRIRMRTHIKECPKLGSKNLKIKDKLEDRLAILEQDIEAIRSVLNEEIRQRLHLITDVGNLRKQNQISDEWTQQVDAAIHSMQAILGEETNQRSFEVEQCQNDFRYCFDLTQTLKSELQQQINEMQKQITERSLEIKKERLYLTDTLVTLEDNVQQHEKSLRVKIQQMDKILSDIMTDLQTKFVTNTELNTKQVTMDYEVKSMKNIVCDTEERCERLEQVVAGMDKALHHTMQSLADLETHLSTQQRITSIQNTRGHLIWRIKDYSKRLEEAKQYDTILHSAMFTNKPFGYALRLDIHLNGKGTWKGRNVIACLNVITGEFDTLLPWPCKLQADVIIRDQCDNPANIQDYVKTIHVRKKSDELLLSNQYFHIPHRVVTSRNYLRNDCVFFEIRVHKSNYL